MKVVNEEVAKGNGDRKEPLARIDELQAENEQLRTERDEALTKVKRLRAALDGLFEAAYEILAQRDRMREALEEAQAGADGET